MVEGYCEQCNKSVNSTNNRLVKDSCGHVKCRNCLLDDISGCSACANTGEVIEIEENDIVKVPANNKGHGSKSSNTERKTVSVTHILESMNQDDGVLKQNDHLINQKKDIEQQTTRKKKKSNWPKNVIIEKDSEIVTYYCTVCKKRFRAKYNAKYHKYCDGSSKPHVCLLCDKDFASRSHFEYHMRVHEGQKPFICDICQADFYQKSKLTRHILNKHSDKKHFQCSVCHVNFSSAQTLRQHGFIHSGLKPHQCTICSKQYRDISNLKKHKALHTGNIVRCEICAKSFGDFRSKELHMRRAHTQPSFACLHPHCTRVFRTRKDMQRHFATHSDNKPFRCTVCHIRFKRKDNLDRHLRNSHPGVQPQEGIEIIEKASLIEENLISKPIETNIENGVQDLRVDNSILRSRNPLPPLPLEQLPFSKHFILEANIKRDTVIFGPTTTEKVPSDEKISDKSPLNVTQDFDDMSYKILKKKMNQVDLYRKILIAGKKYENKDKSKEFKEIPEYIHKKVNYELKNPKGESSKVTDERRVNSEGSNINMELYKKILIPDYKEKTTETKSAIDKNELSKTDEISRDNVNRCDMHWRRKMALNMKQ